MASPQPSPPASIPSFSEPSIHTAYHLVTEPPNASSPSSSSASLVPGADTSSTSNALQKPKLSTRKSSGTIIIPREHPNVELKAEDETFDKDDARAMSPRRTGQDLERMRQDARAQLERQAKILQASLLEIFNRIEAVKEEHDKLDNNNKFLQKYIGDLMSTSKITSTGAIGKKK